MNNIIRQYMITIHTNDEFGYDINAIHHHNTHEQYT